VKKRADLNLIILSNRQQRLLTLLSKHASEHNTVNQT